MKRLAAAVTACLVSFACQASEVRYFSQDQVPTSDEIASLLAAQAAAPSGPSGQGGRTRLVRLSDFNIDGEDDDTKGQITSLGLTYHLLTPHTAFVAVDETVRNPSGAGEDVDLNTHGVKFIRQRRGLSEVKPNTRWPSLSG